jgi:hypothetical protein
MEQANLIFLLVRRSGDKVVGADIAESFVILSRLVYSLSAQLGN